MKQKRKIIIIAFLAVALVQSIGFAGYQARAEERTSTSTGERRGPLECPPETPYYVNGKCEKCPAGQKPDQAGKCQLENPAPGQLVDTKDFQTLLKNIINIFLMFAGAIAVIFLMVGGFQYVASRGNEEATEKAKKTVTNAVIGIVLIVMSFAIVNIVNTLLTKPPKEQAGTSKAPGPSGGPGATPAALNFTYFNPTQSAFCPLNGECEIGIGQVTGGTGPYDLAQTSGAPGGTTILISPGDGRLYLDGSPNEEGTFSISVTIRDKSSTPQSIIREFTLSVE